MIDCELESMAHDSSINEFGQPIGLPVKGWQTRARPEAIVLEGQYCRLEGVKAAQYLDDFYEFFGPDSNPADWTYLPLEHFEEKQVFYEYLVSLEKSTTNVFYAIIDKVSGKAIGSLALIRIDEVHGSIEAGFVVYSDQLKRTRIATEAQYLLACYVFDQLKYRRYEWKCDSLNAPSRNAALRLGFTYEGTFRNAVVYKGRNRDTDWFSIIDIEWPDRKARLQRWLEPSNFDEAGNQVKKLSEF